MRRIVLGVIAAVALASPAFPQTYHDSQGTIVPGIVQIGAFSAGTVTFTATTGGASVTLPGAVSRYPTLNVENTGAQDVWVKNGGTAAVSGGTYIRAGSTKCLSTAGLSSFSGITQSSTTTVAVTQSNGCG